MNKQFVFPVFCAILLSMAMTPALAQVCTKKSPPHTVALLELYTSEGCSSCPPADKFVSGLHSSLQSEQVVPLSLHVDYWDYIGWKDIFAQPKFTERQRWLSNIADAPTIYTPEIFISGKELRNWAPPQGNVTAAVKRINEQAAQADIMVSLGKMVSGNLPVEVRVNTTQKSKLFVALYENGLATKIKAGENKDVMLKHDYVVRDWIGPIDFESNNKAVKIPLPRTLVAPSGVIPNNLGVAAFVQTDRGQVLQAVSLPLCAA